MQITPLSINKSNLNVNLNQAQQKVGFSGVKEFVRQPEFDKLIRETRNETIYPVIKEVKGSIADAVKGCWIALTGAEAKVCRQLEQKGDLNAFEKVVADAKKRGIYKKA